MTAEQAVPPGCVEAQNCPLFSVGATAWYFVQGLVQAGVVVPIGVLDTAIGGQRIEEFMVGGIFRSVLRLSCMWTRVGEGGRSFLL
jgi:hypothetical protein